VFLTCSASPRDLGAGPERGEAAMLRPSAGSRYSAAVGPTGTAIGESPSESGRRVSGVAMIRFLSASGAMTLARDMPGRALPPPGTTIFFAFNY